MQSLVGETAVISNITYPCIVGIESLQQTLTDGGWKAIAHVNVSINLTDIIVSAPPTFGATALLVERNRTYRVNGVTPSQTTYELELIDITA